MSDLFGFNQPTAPFSDIRDQRPSVAEQKAILCKTLGELLRTTPPRINSASINETRAWKDAHARAQKVLMMKTSMHVRSEVAGRTLANREFMRRYVTDQKPKKPRRQKKSTTLKTQAPKKNSGIVPQLNLDALIESMASSLVFSIVSKVKEKLPKALAAISMPEMLEKGHSTAKIATSTRSGGNQGHPCCIAKSRCSRLAANPSRSDKREI